jgi:RimJ/RimL family protein N-acetyltransferase
MARALLFGEEDAVRRFVDRVNGRITNWGPSQAIGVTLDGELVCGVVYNNYRRFDLDMHVSAISPRWASRRIVGTLLAYPFVGLGCVRVTATIAATNDRARKLLRQLGFHSEGFHPMAWEGREDALSYGMLRSDAARWIGALRGTDGQRQSEHAAAA